MSFNRRRALQSSAAVLLSAWGGKRLAVAAGAEAAVELKHSPLIYLSPLLTDGRESRCHAEVWFVHARDEIFVVTWADKWKAKAMRRGFKRARIWIGDFGPWRSAQGRYLTAPTLEIEGRFENDPATHKTLLEAFASKYKTQWPPWDQRVRDGLSNGGWVMLRYQIVS